MAGNVKLNAPSGGSVTLSAVDTASNFTMTVPAAAGVLINATSATGAAQLPVGTTAQRPASPVAGQLRFNSTTGTTEIYNGTGWGGLGGYDIEYLFIGGGGGGFQGNGSQTGGGGGAGGYITGTIQVVPTLAYTVTVGAGHAQNSGYVNSTTFGTIFTAYAGGRGLSYGETGTANATGGSGGGAGQQGGAGGYPVKGQGNYGGAGNTYWSGGGGGAGANGGVAGGGNGLSSSITGTAVTRAGGGGGAFTGGGSGGGGTGGGGAGQGGNGTANTGGGGGGGLGGAGSGGSGIAIVRYLGSQRATGGTVTSSGGYTIHTFTSSGTFTA
jgi:hypothetical protein